MKESKYPAFKVRQLNVMRGSRKRPKETHFLSMAFRSLPVVT